MPIFPRRHSIVLIVIAYLSLSTAAQGVWRPYTDDEAGFTVSFPGKPIYEQSGTLGSGDFKETYKFQYGENFLSITLTPLLRTPRNSLELSQAYAEIAKEFTDKGTLVRQEKLPGGGRQYYNVSHESSGKLHMIIRSYIYRDRHYQLVYGTFASTGVDERVAERFFASFSFVAIRPSRKAPTGPNLGNQATRRPVQSPTWYVLKGADGDFVVEFPGKPENSRTSHPEVDTDVYKFHFFFGENLFVLTYWDVQRAKNSIR